MKKLTLLLLLTIVFLNGYCQIPSFVFGPVPYRTLKETVGETYIIIPVDPAPIFDGIHSFITLADDYHGLPAQYSLRHIKLIGLDEKKGLFTDSLGTKFSCHVVDGTMPDVVPLNDFLQAQKLLLNKTVWLNAKEIFVGTLADIQHARHIKDVRFEPVTITGIEISFWGNAPLLFTFKTAKGDVAFLTCNISGTNSDVLQPKSQFTANFFTENPKTLYHLTPEMWKQVKDDYVQIGMTKDAVRLVDGPPKTINTTRTAHTVSEQWVYGDETVTRNLYFTNGKLTTIQN